MRRPRERGAVAIEFALLLPVLLMLVLGVMDYGWYFMCQLGVTNAAREGARAGTTVPGGDANLARTTTTTYLANAKLSGQTTTVNVTIGSAPTSVTVDVSMAYKPLIGFVPLPSTAHATAVMLGVQ